MELDWNNVFWESEFFKVIEGTIPNRKTNIYFIKNNSGCCIGEIRWYGPWRKFCFFPAPDTIWDNKCINAVYESIKYITDKYKQNKKGCK